MAYGEQPLPTAPWFTDTSAEETRRKSERAETLLILVDENKNGQFDFFNVTISRQIKSLIGCSLLLTSSSFYFPNKDP